MNGLEIQAEEGWTLLETARFFGIEIPTLCHHDGLSAWGGCRLCVVEIGEGKAISPRMERADEEIFQLPLPEEEKEIKRAPRIPLKFIELKHRISSFDECVAGYDPEQAVEEASRCLRCDVKEEKQVAVTAKVGSR